MEIKENRVELSIEEGINDFGFPKDIGRFGNKIITTQEFIQDFESNQKFLFSIRGKEITDEEIQGWQEREKYLDNLNWESVRRKVCILTDRDGRRDVNDPYGYDPNNPYKRD